MTDTLVRPVPTVYEEQAQQYTLDPEIKAEWLRRLRSGTIPQGKQYLNRDGAMCCLGVLCEMAAEAGAVSAHTTDFGTRAFGDDHSTSWTPAEVVRWAIAPDFGNDGTAFSWFTTESFSSMSGANLALLNDSGEYDFAAIADVIERDY